MTTTKPTAVQFLEGDVLEVAIIGAGPSGIIAAKTLLQDSNNIPPNKLVVLEETSSCGGLWNRESRPSLHCLIEATIDSNADQQSPPSTIEVPSSSQPVYQDLRANFPKDLTSFLGYPFPTLVEMFPDPATVAKYYQGFAAKTGVDKVIRFHSRVEKCRKQGEVWQIETKNTQTQEVQQYTSRLLLVCNGHFRKAFCPNLPGIHNFKGKLLHSSAFGSPLDHANQTVLIVGGGISGSDIAKILLTSGACRRVVVSARAWNTAQRILLPSRIKKGLIVRPGIEKIDANGRVHFQEAPLDAKSKYTNNLPPTEQPDVILFATGYRYHFPFLESHKSGGGPCFVRKDGYKMERLYKRIVSIDDPSLAFLAVTNNNISPAISMEYQAKWYAKKVVKGRLPSQEIMLKEVQSRANDNSQDALAAKFPAYCNSLAVDIGVRGYWTQILFNRMPLMLKTGWSTSQWKTSWTGVSVVALGMGVATVLASRKVQ